MASSSTVARTGAVVVVVAFVVVVATPPSSSRFAVNSLNARSDHKFNTVTSSRLIWSALTSFRLDQVTATNRNEMK